MYLKRALSAATEALICNNSLTQEGLTLSWNTLCERYDNKRRLIEELFNDLTKKAPARPKDSESLNTLITTVSNHRKLLLAHVPKEELGDILITANTLKLLDRSTREAWKPL